MTTACYDSADRLVSSSDPRFGAVAYDERGNTTTLGDQVLAYDASDRHIATTPASGAAITYRRDPLDRIVERSAGIGFRSAASADNGPLGATTLSIPTPEGVSEGDVMLMHVAAAGGEATSITPPSGWTSLHQTAHTTAVKGAVFVRAAGASEPPERTVELSAPLQAAGAIAAWRGVDPADPVAGSSEATATGTEVEVAGVGAQAGARVVGLFASTTSGIEAPNEQTTRYQRSTPGPVTLRPVRQTE